MTILTKMLVLLAFVCASGAAIAAEKAPTKGTKSYQAAKSSTDDVQAQRQERAENTKPANPQDIAPAAGGTEAAEPSTNSLREDLRLPRKN